MLPRNSLTDVSAFPCYQPVQFTAVENVDLGVTCRATEPRPSSRLVFSGHKGIMVTKISFL